MHQIFCTIVLHLDFEPFGRSFGLASAWCTNNSYCTALTKPRNAARSPGDPVVPVFPTLRDFTGVWVLTASIRVRTSN